MKNIEKIIEKIKDELPDVQVDVDGKIYRCVVRGRKNPYATVIGHVGTWEFSWQAIARSVQSGKPLIA